MCVAVLLVLMKLEIVFTLKIFAGLGKKKSKCCCQFRKARGGLEDSSSEEEEGCDQCPGH